uniref:Uncharacterized protein n=1 Tax=Nelumbo nucifera TaxID=4432 RepID=A0A822Y714_NELNU|nr:TPA_asm: hypothetical protein HUJ06_028283 [Nelumbo nucifera]
MEKIMIQAMDGDGSELFDCSTRGRLHAEAEAEVENLSSLWGVTSIDFSVLTSIRQRQRQRQKFLAKLSPHLRSPSPLIFTCMVSGLLLNALTDICKAKVVFEGGSGRQIGVARGVHLLFLSLPTTQQ